ncbi:MAG: ECF transporter S component [Candidatus Bathyarchaeia archaeon]
MSATAIFTALTCAATMVFTVSFPATKGYFNIGDTMVYTSALLFGPYIGALSGGVGSMLADIFLGFYPYAPGTLVIKGIEGAIVGFLAKHRPFKNVRQWRIFTTLMGIAIASLVWTVGTSLYSGSMEITMGFPELGSSTVLITLPEALWVCLALIALFSMAILGLKLDPTIGWTVLSVLLGGMEMVLGYFLYEQIILGYYAIAEVPVNIGQATVGLLLSIPLVKTVKRILGIKEG